MPPPDTPPATTAGAPLVERWLTMLRVERRLSPNTERSYRRDLASFAAWAASRGFDDWSRLDAQHIRAFAAAAHRDGLDPRSIQRRLSAVRGLFRFMIREHLIQHNPAVDVQAPRAAKRLPPALDVDRMGRLLDGPGTAGAPEDALIVRDRAIVELFYSSGLRLSELVGLDLRDIDLKDRLVRVLGKGSKTRIVPVGHQAISAIEAWLRVRAGLANTDTEAAFVGRGGQRLGCRAVERRVTAWARRQGLDVKVYPHLFRHSFATHLLESSQDLRGVQELLGHANISTTQVYTHLDFQHLARVYDAAHPRARRKSR
jgi:integrase/recombinase XerC